MTKLKDSFSNQNEQYWFSVIAELIAESNFSTINLKLTVKNGKVVNIKSTTETNINIGSK